MKRKALLSMFLIIVLTMMIAPAVYAMPIDDDDDDRGGLGKVRDATERFRKLQNAIDAGYNLVPGLDYCFDNPGVGGMGYHYINTSLLDTKVNSRKPEALVYATNNQGKLTFVAVEYIVPIADWDANHARPPKLFGQTFETNTDLQVYTLHAWIWKQNPLGIFSDWNPRVSCP